MDDDVTATLQRMALGQIKSKLATGDKLVASNGKSVKVTQIEWANTHNSFRVHFDDGNTLSLQKIDKLLQAGTLKKIG